MIKKLKRQFILIAMASMLIVMVIIVGMINILNIFQLNFIVDTKLNMIIENKGYFPRYSADIEKGDVTGDSKRHEGPGSSLVNAFEDAWNRVFGFSITPETRYETRYFFVTFDPGGSKVKKVNANAVVAISDDEALKYAKKAIRSGRNTDYIGNYKYLIDKTPDRIMVAVVDCHNEIRTMNLFLGISAVLTLIGLIFVFILISVFSKWVVNPAIRSLEKQKQFITDASHEIKTPLAIISANTYVLEMNSGKNEWTESIKNQTSRLGELTNNLLTLSKLEESRTERMIKPFNMSDAVADVSSQFKLLAKTQNKEFNVEIQEDITYKGVESEIRQMVSLLVDNAVKYTHEGGSIEIHLGMQGKTVKFAIENTCEDIKSISIDNLFDRFYRSDSSRSRETGGYGIGLSIVKSVVDLHGGKIAVQSSEANKIRFTVTLMNK